MAINQNDIIYFILTDRFYGIPNPSATEVDKTKPCFYHGGNLEGIVEKIPYLKNLGITALWVTPVYLQVPSLKDSKGDVSGCPYHGYWPLDFNSIDPHFVVNNGKYPDGSKNYLKDLTDELHKAGIKLILDMVVNHTGYNHPATTNTDPNPTPIRSNWYNPRGLSSNDNTIEGELSCLPDLDLDNIDVSDYHIQTILSWIRECGIDAIRMDTVKHVEKAFWNFFKTQIKGKYPDITLIGEVLEFNIDAISEYQQHMAFDSLFDFPMQEAIKNVFIYDQSLKLFVSPFNNGQGILEKDNHYTNHNRLVTLLDNHDLEARIMSMAIKHVGGHEKKDLAAAVLKLALSFMFTIRGIPQIYYGTEIGMEGFGDPENRKDFEWDKIDESQNVKDDFKIEKDIFEHTRKMIRIRKENDALCCGSFVPLYVDDFIFVYLRYFADNAIITVIHNGWIPMPDQIKVSIDKNPAIPDRIKDSLRNREMNCQVTDSKIKIENGAFKIQMDRKSALVLK